MRKNKENKKQRKNISDQRIVYNLLSRIYKALKNNQPISFKKLRDCQGEYDCYCDEIILDYRKEILPTLIHEFIHKFHPTKSESWVEGRERFVMRRISPYQAKRLITLLSYII